MKKLFILILFFTSVSFIFAQNNSETNEQENQENAVTEQVFDNQNEENQIEEQIENQIEAQLEEHNNVENTSEDSDGILQQYQTFSWKKIAKAKKYEILIEKQQDDNSWVSEISEQTTDNRIEILLYPGNYRVAISVFNALGRKTSTTDWTPFIILNETQPYLYTDSLKKSESWRSPLLTVKHEESTIIEEIDDEGSIVAREGDPTNSIFLKGKNIFFPNTTFSLVPKENSEFGKPFVAYVDLREEVPLNIVRRDTENGGVVVSYNPSALFSGYYDIVAKNPGGQTANLELLVFSADSPKIDSSTFKYNNHYKVSTIDYVKDGNEYTLSITGTGFGNNTIFTLEPTNGLISYPFTSSFERYPYTLNVNSHKCLDNKGTVSLEFKIPSNGIGTGYYKFTANNGANGYDSLLLLVNVISEETYAPEISKIKTKTDKTNHSITYQLTGSNIDKYSNFSLISPYDEETDSNNRIKIDYITSKKKGTRHILSGDLKNIEPGIYALLIENGNTSKIVYLEADKKLGFSIYNISNVESEKIFLRPESKAAIEKVHITEKFEITPYDYDSKIRPKVLFSTINAGMSVLGDVKDSSSIDGYIQINLLNFNWLRWAVGGNYYLIPKWDTSGFQAGTDLYLEIPNFYFRPYIGAGFYTTFKYNESEYTTFLRNYSVPISFGFKFVEALDFRYTLSVENVMNGFDNYFLENKFSIGVNIPIRGSRYIKKVNTTQAEIANEEMVDGNKYKLKKNTEYIQIDSPVVKGFNGKKSITSVALSSNVKQIEQKTFANCENLESVEMSSGLEVISEEAFANCLNISNIEIPESVTTIKEKAFDGWNITQKITLNWTSDDETLRDLSGLKDCNAYIVYSDGVIFNDSKINPFCKVENWNVSSNYSLTKATLITEGVITKEEESVLALTAKGNIASIGRDPMNLQIVLNSTNVPEISSYQSGKTVKGVSFGALLDGDVKAYLCFTNKYDKVISRTKINVNSNSKKYSVKKNDKGDVEGMYIEVTFAPENNYQQESFELSIFDFEILK